VQIELLDNENIIYITSSGINNVIKNEDILVIEKHLSFGLAGGGLFIFPSDRYSYHKIKLKNGDCFIITSLLLEDFKLFPEKVIIKKKLIAIIT
jgi:hypothetical protein